MHANVGIEPSKLSKDIFQLEKDFRYNLFLLKVRDTEIARCKTQNEQLLHELHSKDHNIAQLQSVIRNMESSLQSTSSGKHQMKITYEDCISALYGLLSDVTTAHESCQREFHIREKKQEVAHEEKCKTIVASMEKRHQKELAEISDRLQKEMCLVEKLNSDLENIITENVALHAESHKRDSNNISKLSILESELQSSQKKILDLEMKLEESKKNYCYLETDLKRTITEKDQVKQELSKSNERNRKSERKLKEISAEKDNLNHLLNTSNLKLQRCLTDLQQVKEENDLLKAEIQHSKAVLKEQICNTPGHDNLEMILKQNLVLQEVVKAMRKKRNEAISTQEIEKKVNKLENIVQCLKDSMLNKIIDIEIDTNVDDCNES